MVWGLQGRTLVRGGGGGIVWHSLKAASYQPSSHLSPRHLAVEGWVCLGVWPVGLLCHPFCLQHPKGEGVGGNVRVCGGFVGHV